MKTPIKISGFVYKIIRTNEIVFVTASTLNSSMGYLPLGPLEIEAEFDIPEIDLKAQIKIDLEKRIEETKAMHTTQLQNLESELRRLDED